MVYSLEYLLFTLSNERAYSFLIEKRKSASHDPFSSGKKRERESIDGERRSRSACM
jgi:hypothetical protein